MDSAERWTQVARIDGPRRAWVRAWWGSRWRPVPFVLLMAAGAAGRRGQPVDLVAPNASTAVAEALAARGLACDADDVAWVDGPRGVYGTLVGGARALVR